VPNHRLSHGRLFHCPRATAARTGALSGFPSGWLIGSPTGSVIGSPTGSLVRPPMVSLVRSRIDALARVLAGALALVAAGLTLSSHGSTIRLAAAPPALAQTLWPAGSSGSSGSPDSVTAIADTIVVTARRHDPHLELARRSGFATVIPLGAEAPAERDLADLLDRTAGLQVHRYGGLGAFSQAGVRGSAPGHVQVCLDGVPVASAGDGFVNLALLPVAIFGHAEVLRGAQTSSYGGPPAAGVINLVSPQVMKVSPRFAGGGGSFGTSHLRGLWGHTWGPGGVYVAGQLRRSDGDFEYTDRNGTYFQNTEDDSTVSRKNNDFEDRALLARASLRWPLPSSRGGPPGGRSSCGGPTIGGSAIGGSAIAGSTSGGSATAGPAAGGSTSEGSAIAGSPSAGFASAGLPSAGSAGAGSFSAGPSSERYSNGTFGIDAGESWIAKSRRSVALDYTALLFHRDGGVPGTESVQTKHTRFRTDRRRHEVVLRGSVAAAWPVRLEGALHRERIRDRFDNPDAEVGLGRSATDNRTSDGGHRLSAGWILPPLGQQLRVTRQDRIERWTPHDRLRDTIGFTRRREHRTVSVEDRTSLWRIEAEAAYHWARATDNYAGPVGWGQPVGPSPDRTRRFESPVFGLRADCGGGLVLKGNRGRMTRFPSFPELFGQNGVQEGNPSLKNETGHQWDAGLSWSPRLPLRLESAYFESVTRDKITLIQNSQRTVKAQNVDRAWVRGIETSAFTSLAVPGAGEVDLQVSHTWQEARDLGKSRTYRDKKLPNLPDREAYVALDFRRAAWKLRWDLSARSAHFRDRVNSAAKRTPPSTIHGTALERSFLDGSLAARVEVRNVFDRRVEDIDGFPLPGRSFGAAITWSP